MQRHEYAIQLLTPYVQLLTAKIKTTEQELQQAEAQIAAGLLPNSFQLTVHIRPQLAIKNGVQTEAHLGVSEINLEEYFNLIHNEWWKLYLIFRLASYAISLEYTEDLAGANASSQLKIPLKINEEGQYVWYNQVSIPIGFATDGTITTLVNVYQMDRQYDVNYLMAGPLTIFERRVAPKISRQIQSLAQRIFYAEYVENTKEKRLLKKPFLTDSQAKVLYLFRRLCYKDRQDKVTSESVAALSNKLWPEAPLTKAAVSSHTRDIRNHFESYCKDGTPLNKNNFGTFREMAAFLNSLFGNPQEPIFS